MKNIESQIPIIGRQEKEKKKNDQEKIDLIPVKKVKMSLKDFIHNCHPLYGGMCYILREALPDKVGELHIPTEVQRASMRGSTAGVILKISPYEPLNANGRHEHAVQQFFKLAPGDRVLFDVNVPRIIGKSYLVDMPQYPIQLTHVGDIHTRWTGPLAWDDNNEVKELIKELKEEHEIAIKNLDWTP